MFMFIIISDFLDEYALNMTNFSINNSQLTENKQNIHYGIYLLLCYAVLYFATFLI